MPVKHERDSTREEVNHEQSLPRSTGERRPRSRIPGHRVRRSSLVRGARPLQQLCKRVARARECPRSTGGTLHEKGIAMNNLYVEAPESGDPEVVSQAIESDDLSSCEGYGNCSSYAHE